MDTIVITGANRGLGQATARYLLQRGHTVVLSGRNQETLRSQAERLRQEGLTPEALAMDVTSSESVEVCAAEVAARHGSIDCIVNNAGIMVKSESTFEDFSPQTFWTTIETNVLGIFRVLKAFVPLLADSRNPRIVNISSGYGVIQGMGSNHPSYRLSKTLVNAMTVQSHHAWYESRGIRSLAVCPGWVKTDMGGAYATSDLDQGVEGIAWAIMTAKDGPSGGLFRHGRPLPW